jgi:hypothetical protein
MTLARVLVLLGFVPPYWLGLWMAANMNDDWEMGTMIYGFLLFFSFFSVAISATIAGIVAPQISAWRLLAACAAGTAILIASMNLAGRFAPGLMSGLGGAVLIVAVWKIMPDGARPSRPLGTGG